MQNTTIRERLHDVVEHSDDRLLNILFAVAMEYNTVIEAEVLVELQRRTESRQAGTSRTHRWEEAKQMITGQRPL